MGKNTDRARTAEDIEIIYSDFLSDLKAMPTGTVEARRLRKQAVMSFPALNDLVEDLLHAYKPSAYSKLMKHLGNVSATAASPNESERNTQDSKWNAGNPYNKEMLADSGHNRREIRDKLWDSIHTDPSLFYEAILAAAEYYTGHDQSGKPVPFLASVGFKFKQMAGMQYAKESVEANGKIPEISENRIAKIYKLAMNVRELKEAGANTNFEDTLNNMDAGFPITKKEREAVLLIASGQYRIKELDAYAYAEDQETTLGEVIPDQKDAYEELEDREATGSLLKSFFLHWDSMNTLFRKREKECVRIFLTKDILQPLKLDSHGEAYREEPAGNPDLYEALSPYEPVVYGRIFYMEYINYAVTGAPSDLYDVYANLLREGFRFSDKEIADALGRDKTFISKQRKLYGELQLRMRDYCSSLEHAV